MGRLVVTVLSGLSFSSSPSFAELAFWPEFRTILNSASGLDRVACGAASEGVAAKATAKAFLQSHTLVGSYLKNTSSEAFNAGSFLDVCESFASFGWVEGVMPCVSAFITSVACLARVRSDFPSYSLKVRDRIGTDILDSLGPWEGKRVLDWLLFGPADHLRQWLQKLSCSGWTGISMLETSGWPAGLREFSDSCPSGCSEFSLGPVMEYLLSRLTRFHATWFEEQQNQHAVASSVVQRTPSSLEALMYEFHTDKARDDHKYSDLYGMLFDSIRHRVSNVTELGVMAGQSLKVWHEYFANATIYGIDIFVYYDLAVIQAKLASFDRVKLLVANTQRESSISALGLTPGSMDLIIDDASHTLESQQRSLHIMWRFVRAGGYYIIEDLEWDRYGDRGKYPVIHYPEQLKPKTIEILRQNDAFFADTSVGHRAFDLWARRLATFSPDERPIGLETMDRISHSSHVLVIRKRIAPLPPVAVQMNVKALTI